MVTVNNHEAKTKLSKLADRADAPKRIGFLKDEFSIPDDFDQMGRDEILELFIHV